MWLSVHVQLINTKVTRHLGDDNDAEVSDFTDNTFGENTRVSESNDESNSQL